MITPYQNSDFSKNSSVGNNLFKEQLHLAITTAAHKGVSVLCDGEDITLYPPSNSSEVIRYVNSDGRHKQRSTPKSI